MTVLDAVKQSETSYIMSKGSIKLAQKLLSSSETILWALVSNVYSDPVRGELSTVGYVKGMLYGVIVVTDQRILFVNSVLGRATTKEIRLSDIRSIDAKTGSVFACLRIIGSSSMIVTTNSTSHIIKLKNAINEALSRRDSGTAACQHSSDDSLQASDIQQLQTLKQLYDSGIITAEEFTAKKAQILNL